MQHQIEIDRRKSIIMPVQSMAAVHNYKDTETETLKAVGGKFVSEGRRVTSTGGSPPGARAMQRSKEGGISDPPSLTHLPSLEDRGPRRRREADPDG